MLTNTITGITKRASHEEDSPWKKKSHQDRYHEVVRTPPSPPPSVPNKKRPWTASKLSSFIILKWAFTLGHICIVKSVSLNMWDPTENWKKLWMLLELPVPFVSELTDKSLPLF